MQYFDIPSQHPFNWMSECCASGSCEVCRRPAGYSRERREQISREYREYDPPWVLGNIQRAEGIATELDKFYCGRCGGVHGPGECLRGDR